MKKTFIIAEAGVNHNGKLEIAFQLIDAAVSAKVDAIKFQTFKTESIVTRNAPKAAYQQKATGKNESQFDMIKKLELKYSDFKKLKQYCDFKKIQFLSTGDFVSLDFLYDLGVNFLKIPSGEIDDLPYLRKIGSFKKNIIFSTGMSTLKEIEIAVNILKTSGTPLNKIWVLHCTTEYPAPFSDVNLLAMQTIHKKLKVKVGYSDHTRGIEVPIAAVALGAEMIEKHFTLDRNMEGPDHKASLEPAELKMMVDSIRNIEVAFGDGTKKVSASEKKNIKIVRKSIYYARSLVKGHKIEEKDLVMKRPAYGISPMKIDDIIGHRLTRNVSADSIMYPEDYS